ncbi:MAG: protein translocase subunit SecD, partial [Roseburia sp.]|nr:protein translocase subunit SecD [Roseburia sp.]
MKKSKAIAVLVVILAALAGLAYYASLILSSTGAGADMSIPLGLDLSGGVSITYQIMDENPSAEDISDTKYKLQKRVESYSTEASVYQVGDDRITVEIPGVTDANAILEELGNPGSLEFQLSDGTVYMTGDMIENAQAATTTNSYGNNSYVVELILTDEGAEVFAEVTAENVGNTLPIVYDGEVISNPVVNSAITGGQAMITGMTTYEQAETLATQIRIGALSLELQELESSVVGAQLGSHAISSSLKAAAIGLVLVMIFMIVMYLVPGVAASLAFAIYTGLVIATLYWFEITLTLPGIAGIILGIGMAVDANVIIFARIREEIATGKTVQTSMRIGFQKAMSAILDGNITTLLAAVVLMALGSGTVKGFAYTLMIGIVLSMFTALAVTRWILYALYGLGFKSEKFYGQNKPRKSIDFIGKKAVFFTISLVVIAAGFIGMAVQKASGNGALNYGLDFVGGTSTTADFGKDYTIDEIEAEIVPLVAEAIGSNDIMANKVEGTTQITIKTGTLSLEKREAVNQVLADNFGIDEATITSQSISSTISNEMRSDAVIAVVVASICMLIYIWF